MKIADIVNNLPKKVKLNNKFTLEESFDVNTILQVKGVTLDFDGGEGEKCYKVFVTALAEDMKYNRSIAIPDWFDDNHKPTLTYFDAMKKAFDQWGNLNDVIYVMENDDCFDLIENDDNTRVQFAIDELNKLSNELERKNKILLAITEDNRIPFSEKTRIDAKMEGVNVAIEEIRRQLKDLNDNLK